MNLIGKIPAIFLKKLLERNLVLKQIREWANISALQHHARYKAFSDSLLDKEKARQFNQLSLKFETEKKDKELIVKNNAYNYLINSQNFSKRYCDAKGRLKTWYSQAYYCSPHYSA